MSHRETSAGYASYDFQDRHERHSNRFLKNLAHKKLRRSESKEIREEIQERV